MKPITPRRTASLAVWLCLLGTSLASAQHVVYLDFETRSFDLSAFGIYDPFTLAYVKGLTEVAMQRNYAFYEVQVTRFQPVRGRYTRVVLGGLDPRPNHSANGTVDPGACVTSSLCGTDIGSWEQGESVALVFSDRLSELFEFTGPNATPERIGNALGNISSHEVGHILGLLHQDASDPESGDDIRYHMMRVSPPEEFATFDKYFSYHVSNDKILEAVGARNFHRPLQNVSGDSAGRADLIYGEIFRDGTNWLGRVSNGSGFGSVELWAEYSSLGRSLVFLGDVNGDGRADLVEGRPMSATSVRWYVQLSQGDGFGPATVWNNNGGDLGDIFRLADVDGDGMDDLVYGRPLSASNTKWYVRLSTGSEFGGYSVWRNDAGNRGDLFFVTDVSGDGMADLVYGRPIDASTIKWYVRESTGSGFGGYSVWSDDAGNRGDRFLLGDLDGDGDSDLVYGRRRSLTQIEWFARKSTGSSFGGYTVWRSDAGNAGNLFRLGDIDGDGRLDLVYAEKRSVTQLKWFGRYSDGSSFGSYNTLRNDAGNEGFLVP